MILLARRWSLKVHAFMSHRPLPYEYFLERLKPVNILVPSL